MKGKHKFVIRAFLYSLIGLFCILTWTFHQGERVKSAEPAVNPGMKQASHPKLTPSVDPLNQSYWNGAPNRKANAYSGAGKSAHLLVVQLESFQNILINTFVDGQELTPVLNCLQHQSLYFPYIYEQIGRGNTSDAEFAVNTSLYPVGAEPMSEKFSHKEIPSLARLLKGQGYVTGTFHVNKASFWNRNNLYPALGFDAYYDKPFFKKENFTRFGASDEELFRVGANELKKLDNRGRRGYYHFITVSSHSPYVIPKEKQRLKLTDKFKDTSLGKYLTAANYTDYALGTFIKRLQEEGIWDRCVLVVYGDHFGLNKKRFDPKELSQVFGKPYDKQLSTFNVPLLIHLPKQVKGSIVDQMGGQVDILPTVAGIMGTDLKAYTAFGHDLLNIDHNLIGMRYYLPTGSFFNDEILFIPGKKGFADGTATSIRTHQPVRDFSRYEKDYHFILKWMKWSDQYVNQLPERLNK